MKQHFIVTIIVFALFAGSCKKYAVDAELAQANLQSQAVTSAPLSPIAIWRNRADFPTAGRYHAFSFSILGKGYTGGGDNHDFLFPVYDFWAYDATSNVWTQKANVPNGQRVGAASFVISNKGYITTGFTLSDPHLYFGNKSDTWMYDPATNVWTAKADFPGRARGGAVGMGINGKGYVGTGGFHNNLLTGDTFYRDWWQYDAATNAWTRKADFPGASRCYAAGSGVGTSGYMGSGTNGIFYTGTNYGDWYQYSTTTDTWTLKSSKAFAVRNSAVAMTVNKRIYLGTGTTGDPLSGGSSTAKSDMAQYDPIANTWTALTNLPVTRSGAAIFAIADSIYVGTGFTPKFYALTVY